MNYDIFGIHPVEASMLLCKLHPMVFQTVRELAMGRRVDDIAAERGVKDDAIRQLCRDATLVLGCERHGFARIWFSAQYLDQYLEERKERNDKRKDANAP